MEGNLIMRRLIQSSLVVRALINSKKLIASTIDLNGKLVWQKEVGGFISKFGYAPFPLVYKS